MPLVERVKKHELFGQTEFCPVYWKVQIIGVPITEVCPYSLSSWVGDCFFGLVYKHKMGRTIIVDYHYDRTTTTFLFHAPVVPTHKRVTFVRAHALQQGTYSLVLSSLMLLQLPRCFQESICQIHARLNNARPLCMWPEVNFFLWSTEIAGIVKRVVFYDTGHHGMDHSRVVCLLWVDSSTWTDYSSCAYCEGGYICLVKFLWFCWPRGKRRGRRGGEERRGRRGGGTSLGERRRGKIFVVSNHICSWHDPATK